MRLRRGMNSVAPGCLTSIEKPTRSGSGSTTSKPSIVMRSPRQSLVVKPSLVLVTAKSLICRPPGPAGPLHGQGDTDTVTFTDRAPEKSAAVHGILSGVRPRLGGRLYSRDRLTGSGDREYQPASGHLA